MTELTPEQQEIQRQIEAAGLVDEPTIIQDGAQEMPPEGGEPPKAGEPPTPDATGPPAPASEPPAIAPDRMKDLEKSVGDLKGWAEREKARADEARGRAQALEEENRRLRLAVGTPPPAATEKPLTPEQQQARQWLAEHVGELLPDLLAKLPEETLEKLPFFAKRDRALFTTRDAVDQQEFIATFPRGERRAVRERIIPILAGQRAQSGFRKGYSELFEEQQKAMRESAAAWGLTAAPGETPPAAPPTTPPPPATPPAPTYVPPSLSGLQGGPPKPSSTAPPMTEEEARVWGLH